MRGHTPIDDGQLDLMVFDGRARINVDARAVYGWAADSCCLSAGNKVATFLRT